MVASKGSYKLHKNADFALKKAKKGVRGRTSKPLSSIAYIGPDKKEVRTRLTYDTLEEGASKMIREKFCDITGFETTHTHHKNFLNYLDRFVYKYIKQIPKNSKDEFRALRNIKKGF